MSRSVGLRLLLIGFFVTGLFTGCSRDPNVRKQKFLESGNRYRDKGKFREAAIQYSNAVQMDPRFAEAHFQLGETYLKLKDFNRAYAELSRTLDLAAKPNYARRTLTWRICWWPPGTPSQAQPHLDLLREKQPNNPRHLYGLGKLRCIAGQPGSSAARVAERNRRRPYSPRHLFESRYAASPRELAGPGRWRISRKRLSSVQKT